jgi:hypothetical protein
LSKLVISSIIATGSAKRRRLDFTTGRLATGSAESPDFTTGRPATGSAESLLLSRLAENVLNKQVRDTLSASD